MLILAGVAGKQNTKHVVDRCSFLHSSWLIRMKLDGVLKLIKLNILMLWGLKINFSIKGKQLVICWLHWQEDILFSRCQHSCGVHWLLAVPSIKMFLFGYFPAYWKFCCGCVLYLWFPCQSNIVQACVLAVCVLYLWFPCQSNIVQACVLAVCVFSIFDFRARVILFRLVFLLCVCSLSLISLPE